jgi:hypothetical protein
MVIHIIKGFLQKNECDKNNLTHDEVVFLVEAFFPPKATKFEKRALSMYLW